MRNNACPIAIADDAGHMWTRALALSDNEALLDGVTKHRDGYLMADARIARVGTQRYRGYEVGLPDRENVTLFRPAEEVFATKSMHSHANKPVTLLHPKTMVDSKTWGKVAKGFSGSDVVRDGDYVRVPLMLTDAAAIAAYEDGKARELSVGYTTDIDWTAGMTPDGTPYDGVQRDIRTNHHALVPVARGGDRLRLGDYSAGEPRDKFGKWSKADMDEFHAAVAKIAELQAKGPPLPTHTNLELRPEDYDDNDLNEPSLASLAAPDFKNHPEHAENVRVASGFLKAMVGNDAGCPNCGGAVSEDAINCPTCGYDLKPLGNQTNDMMDASFTAEERRDLAKRGLAKPDGSYPIRNKEDLAHAKQAFGRGGATASDRAWINKRAKALGEPLLGETEAADAALQRSSVMPIIKSFDGVPIQFHDEISAAAMVREHSRLQALIDDWAKKSKKKDDDNDDETTKLQKEKQNYQDAIKAKDGEIAVLKKQVADATLTDAQIDARITERLSVIDAAKPHLPKEFNPTGKSLGDIRRATVGISLGDAAIKDWDDAQVMGAFAALTAAGVRKGGATLMADGLSNHMRATDNSSRPGGMSMADAENEAAKAYGEYVKRLQDSYKTPISSARN